MDQSIYKYYSGGWAIIKSGVNSFKNLFQQLSLTAVLYNYNHPPVYAVIIQKWKYLQVELHYAPFIAYCVTIGYINKYIDRKINNEQ